MPSDTPKYPTIGVGGIVFKGDKVLLIQRGTPPRAGQWSIPGGKQEWGETVSEALVREVHEETGVTMTVGGFVDVIDYLTPADPTQKQEGFHYTLLDYWGQWVSGDLVPNEGEILDVRWVALDDLGRYKLWSETTRVIIEAFEMRANQQ